MNSSNKDGKSPAKRSASSGCAVSIRRTARRPWPVRGFADVANRILPAGYALSIVLIGDKRARHLNKTCRDKDTAANVLTFPLSSTEGEIFLNLARITREAAAFGLTPHGHALFLLIHGCLHLNGHAHGSTMEEAENALVRKLNIR